MLLSLVSRRSLEVGSRDAYGFALRPQHVERYREYVDIYKEEESERAKKWKDFIERQEKFVQLGSSTREDVKEDDSRSERSNAFYPGECEPKKEARLPNKRCLEKSSELPDKSNPSEELLFLKESEPQSEEIKPTMDVQLQKEGEFENRELVQKDIKTLKIQEWAHIRPSLAAIEAMLCSRVKKANHTKKDERIQFEDHLPSIRKSASCGDESDEYASVNDTTVEALNASTEGGDRRNDVFLESYFPSQEELAVLVCLGVSKDLRGEVWQAFVGTKTRRIEKYYQNLLAQVMNGDTESIIISDISRKIKKQIDKDIPRTFPGHPALNDNGRDSLRRILLAYAYHNPSVGYCQSMNFVAGLLLLLMPEENAFWTFLGIIDDYFDGYYTEEMIESQVDQLVFEELMHERFPKLVNHLGSLEVQVPWIIGPWFLSIFVNVLPWETVFRIWDVLLFEGNRVMLFRTGLALMELYGPALVRTKDSGDAMTLLQTLAGSTFDSSQLVLTACLGYMAVTESRLQELRDKHRPSVLEVVEERTMRGRALKDAKGLSSKLYSFKHDRPVLEVRKTTERIDDEHLDQYSTPLGHHSSILDDPTDVLTDDLNEDSVPDSQGQVVWLKVELCRLMEEKRSALLRAEELDTALREMAKEDNREQLSTRIEQLEQEVTELRQVFDDKKERETALLQVLMKVEQAQKAAEDARISAEQDAAIQRQAVHVLQEKYEMATAQIAQMEKRMVMAESMLEATLQYERGQSKALSSPRLSHNQSSAQDNSRRKTGILSFGLGWRDSIKGKEKPAII